MFCSEPVIRKLPLERSICWGSWRIVQARMPLYIIRIQVRTKPFTTRIRMTDNKDLSR